MAGVKFDQDKIRTDLLPTDVLEGVAKVLTHGVGKYSARNWEAGMAWGRPYGALLRHLWAFWRGEEIDPESGLAHIDQAVCNAMMLAAYWRRKVGQDDRPSILSSSADSASEQLPAVTVEGSISGLPGSMLAPSAEAEIGGGNVTHKYIEWEEKDYPSYL